MIAGIIRTLRRWSKPLLVAVVAPAALYILVRLLLALVARGQLAASPMLPGREGTREEFVVVFMSASFCGANEQPGFKEAISAIPDLVRPQVDSTEFDFRYIGVSLDANVRTGVKYLAQFGGFHEIVAGGGWLNMGTLRYVWSDGGVLSAVPQVILIRRTVDRQSESIVVDQEERLLALSGAESIVGWVSAGATIPDL